jgi:hypothetical protein
MSVTDAKVHQNARFARHRFRPGPIRDGILTPVAITINGTPEDFDVSAFMYAINGQIYAKAAQTGISLSAIHATGIGAWLGVLVTIDKAGTIATIGNPNTGDQDHATEAAALASLVNLAPVGTIGIGTITLLTGSLDWDGNTDAFDEADLVSSNLSGYSPDKRWATLQPGGKFRITSARPHCRSKSGVAQLQLVTTNKGQNGILTNPRLEVDNRTVAAATIIALRCGHFDYLIDGVAYHKDPETAIAFTAAHVVALNQWGAILVQIDAAGTVSTKVTGATQTTPLDYATAALAIAALPAPDAGNVAVGFVLVESDAGTWTANTDDLVAASDLESVEIYLYGQDRLLSSPALAMDEAEEEDFTVATFTYVIDGVTYTKTAAIGIDFTVAHVCALDKFLAVLIQINPAGTVATRIPLVDGRSQTASQGFDTPNEAIAALPQATPGQLAIGYILIAADASTWTANTDDMEAGVDVDGATFKSNPVPTNLLFAAQGQVFNTNLQTAATLGPQKACCGDEDGQVLVLLGGTTGVVDDPQVDIEYRPYPVSGEAVAV